MRSLCLYVAAILALGACAASPGDETGGSRFNLVSQLDQGGFCRPGRVLGHPLSKRPIAQSCGAAGSLFYTRR